MLLLVAKIYLIISIEFIQTLTINVEHLPPDIQQFVHQKRFLEDGFYSFHMVHPQHDGGGYLKPFHANMLNKLTKREIKLHLPVDKETLILNLTLNMSVLHPDSVVSIANSYKEEMVDIKDLKSCYLVGNIISHGGTATFSYCGEILEGTMLINKNEMLVKSLPEHLHRRHRRSVNDQPFLLASRQLNYSTNYITTNPNIREIYKKRRLNLLRNLTIEIAVYVDSVLTNSLEAVHNLKSMQQKIDFVVIKYNAVQYEYWRERLTDLHITIQLKKILFFIEDPMEHSKENNLDSILESFCSWQRFSIPQYDHVMLLSIKPSIKPGGRAYRPGVCRSSLHCAVNNEAMWGFWYLEAHELGHNNHQAECLFQENVKPEYVEDNNRNITANGLLPGLYLTPDDTCELNYGPGFRYRPYPGETPHTECKFHSCTYLVHNERFGEMKVNRHGIAGAYCGQNMVCVLNLQCVNIKTLNLRVPITVTAGGWGLWGAWSECISVCGPGIRYRERLCTNPKPLNSPQCKGQQYSSVACTGKPCSRREPIHNIIQKSINDLCQRFVNLGILKKEHYSEGRLFGSDKLTACEVICHSNPRLKTDRLNRYGLLPDGTPCELPGSYLDPMRWKKKAICINGACEPIGCDGLLYGKQFDECGVCGGHGDACVKISGTIFLPELPGYLLEVKIPKNAVNIKFKLSDSTKGYLMIFLFSKDNQPVLDLIQTESQTNFSPIKFANSYWDYNAFSFLMSSGAISEAVIVKVLLECAYKNDTLMYNYSVPIEKESCELSCGGGGDLYECSCLCKNGRGGPKCRSCNTVCLNGVVNETTCECQCPSPHMLLPYCKCDKYHGGNNCSECNYVFCGPCGSYDWESCRCKCQKGLTGPKCNELVDPNIPVNCTPDISIEY